MTTLLSVRLTERHIGPGYFLLYLRGRQSIAGTYHLTLQDALDQAVFQFHVLPEEWKNAQGAETTS
jgi:hypothetical protein